MKRDTLFIALVVLALLALGTGVGVVIYNATRGLRNNNPGNIRRVAGTTWQGQSATQTDTAFVQFDDPAYGIRALARVLTNYMGRGLNTVQTIIGTWAPSTENNTGAYVAAVANQMGVDPNAPLTSADIVSLVPAIIHHENGQQPYPPELIAQGVALAVA